MAADVLSPTLLHDVVQWEVRTWSRALPLWKATLDGMPRPLRALGIGEREGGLSLWLALQDIDVTCTDLNPFPEATRALHARHGVEGRISYAQADATALPFPDASFDVVCFKSVIGALGSRESQARALAEMARVLRPGGVLLFAENLGGTPLHRWLRRRYVAWADYWRYLELPADSALFSLFSSVELHTTGLLANLGRGEAQRDLLARLDGLLVRATPARWHTVVHGVARR